MPTHRAGSLIHCHRAYDEPQETSYSMRAYLRKLEEAERLATLIKWEVDSIMTREKDNKPNKAVVTYTHKQA